jgi:hypothetical protein
MIKNLKKRAVGGKEQKAASADAHFSKNCAFVFSEVHLPVGFFQSHFTVFVYGKSVV